MPLKDALERFPSATGDGVGVAKARRCGTLGDTRGYAVHTAGQSPKYHASSSSIAMRLTSCHRRVPRGSRRVRRPAFAAMSSSRRLSSRSHHRRGRPPRRCASLPAAMRIAAQPGLRASPGGRALPWNGCTSKLRSWGSRRGNKARRKASIDGSSTSSSRCVAVMVCALRCGRVGEPWLTSGSPTPSCPSIHRWPKQRPLFDELAHAGAGPTHAASACNPARRAKARAPRPAVMR